jgi:hypothetical protein
MKTDETRESLWWLIISPLIWALHFLLSYATVAIWCAKAADAGGPLGGARVAVFGYTIVALAGVLAMCRWSYRRHNFGVAAAPHDFDSPEGRHGFMGFAGLLLSLLSLVAILYLVVPLLFLETCR